MVYRPQKGKQLGDKMGDAMKVAFEEGAKSVIVVSGWSYTRLLAC